MKGFFSFNVYVVQASRNGRSSTREGGAVYGRPEPQCDPSGHRGEALRPYRAGRWSGHAWRYTQHAARHHFTAVVERNAEEFHHTITASQQRMEMLRLCNVARTEN